MPTHLLRVSSHNGIVSHCLEEPRVQRRYECLQKTKDHVRVKRTAADLYTGTYGQKTFVSFIKIYYILRNYAKK